MLGKVDSQGSYVSQVRITWLQVEILHRSVGIRQAHSNLVKGARTDKTSETVRVAYNQGYRFPSFSKQVKLIGAWFSSLTSVEGGNELNQSWRNSPIINPSSNIAFQDYFLPNTITSIHLNESNSYFTFPFWFPSTHMNHSRDRPLRSRVYTSTSSSLLRGPFMHREYIRVNTEITHTTWTWLAAHFHPRKMRCHLRSEWCFYRFYS